MTTTETAMKLFSININREMEKEKERQPKRQNKIKRNNCNMALKHTSPCLRLVRQMAEDCRS